MMRHKVTKVLHSFRWFLKLPKNALVLHSKYFLRQRPALPQNFFEAAALRIADEESDDASIIPNYATTNLGLAKKPCPRSDALVVVRSLLISGEDGGSIACRCGALGSTTANHGTIVCAT